MVTIITKTKSLVSTRSNADNPEIGKEFTFLSFSNFQVSNKLSVNPIIRFSRLKKINSDENFFKGYITRLSTKYQLNNFLSLRIIAEYNDFQKKLFVQPLLQWNPNPSTIFYIGGNQNALREEIGNNFGSLYLDNSQMFIKFQYLISL